MKLADAPARTECLPRRAGSVVAIGRTARRHGRVLAGLLLFGALAALCLCAPLLTDADPVATNTGALGLPPGPGHPLGTDALGRDLLARVLYGGRVSLTVGLLAATLALLLGVGVGVLAGTGRSWLDGVLMHLIDATLALPLLLVVIAIQAIATPGLMTVVLVIGAVSWMPVSRVVRAEFLSLRERPFVEAAVALGASRRRVALRHILPSALPPVLAVAGYQVAAAILTETSLSFLGLGVPGSTPTWGNILTQAQQYLLLGQWWTLAWPAAAIALTVISVNLVTDGIRLRGHAVGRGQTGRPY
jgi:peptide/nickel transport system permease protein